MGRSRTAGITVDGDGNRIINKQVRGAQIYARLGQVSQDEAERALGLRVAEIERENRRRASNRHAFREAAVKYLEQKKSDGKGTLANDATHLMMLAPWLGDMELENICDQTLRPFVEWRLSGDANHKPVTPTTVARSLEVIRHLLNLAARKWRDKQVQPDGSIKMVPWLETAPPLLSMPVDADEREPYPLDYDEQRLLFSCLPRVLADMALFKVNAGVREQEVCQLEWSWEQKVPELGISVFVVPKRLVKNGEHRVIVMNEIAATVINAQRGRDPRYVFVTNTGKPSVNPHVRKHPVGGMNNTGWQRAREKAAGMYEQELGRACPDGFRFVRVHDLKHTLGRRLRAAGIPKETRSVLLGHTNGDITTHYSAAEIEELWKAVQSLVGQSKSGVTLLRAVA